MIFALEPVWAAGLAGMFLAERLGVFGWFGGALVVANVLPGWLLARHSKLQAVRPVLAPVMVRQAQRWRLENTRTGATLEFDRLADLRSWLEADAFESVVR